MVLSRTISAFHYGAVFLCQRNSVKRDIIKAIYGMFIKTLIVYRK